MTPIKFLKILKIAYLAAKINQNIFDNFHVLWVNQRHVKYKL